MFKAGDKVEVKGYTEEWDGKGVVKEIFRGDILVEFDRPFPRKCGGFPKQYVKLIGNSPVRTVTRREIVPGAYGQVSVISADRGRVEIFIDATSTADQLREAAHLFNQLAEALEDKP